MPFENVDVAVVEVMERRDAESPPENVDVEFVPLTSMNPERVEVAFAFEEVKKDDSMIPSTSMFPVMFVEVPVPDIERV